MKFSRIALLLGSLISIHFTVLAQGEPADFVIESRYQLPQLSTVEKKHFRQTLFAADGNEIILFKDLGFLAFYLQDMNIPRTIGQTLISRPIASLRQEKEYANNQSIMMSNAKWALLIPLESRAQLPNEFIQLLYQAQSDQTGQIPRVHLSAG
ncbi:MAG: hypothetical protein WCG27_10430, partial [Pseudomonadota bacterium]